VASPFFCGDARKALPALVAMVLMMPNPFMLYAGQEYGERGMDEEGFSGRDGRTTIFDYWCVDSLYRGYFRREQLTIEEKRLALMYQRVLRIANREKAFSRGEFFDLMYVNPSSRYFNAYSQYAFLRKCDDEVMFVVCNFSADKVSLRINVPPHAFNHWHMEAKREVSAIDLLSGQEIQQPFSPQEQFFMDVPAYGARVYKFSIKMNKTGYVLNEHNKDEFPPAHTTEHLLNQLMGRLFGCERSRNAHIERKKSKITYILDHKPDRREERMIEQQMNDLINQDLPVTYEMVDRENLPDEIDASRLPDDAGETIRLVRIGDFDVCPCVGKHVRSTSQIGRFVLLGTNWDEMTHAFRIRFKVVS
jgi:hypothetical protein